MEFSPIIMRSFNVGERFAGVVYSDSSLIDANLRGPDQLRFDFFATGREIFEVRGKKDAEQDMFSRILDVTHGPKISSDLTKVENGRYFNDLADRFARIHREYLQ
jgi:hypothetical protein